MAPLFDAYIIVDWSAAARPVTGANSIWICALERTAHQALSMETFNPSTRLNAHTLIFELASDLLTRGRRLLIGFDFALGYPAGTAKALGLDSSSTPPWRAMHGFLADRIVDTQDNSNNRFAVAASMNEKITRSAHPFWGAPPSKTGATLAARKDDFGSPRSLPEHRLAEGWIRSQFQAAPKSVWQLLGAGAVGSQSLVGIPMVTYLRDRLPGAALWPFETGFAELTPNHLEKTPCILAEIYPSALKITPGAGEILDEAQVKAVSKHFESLDSAGILGGAFDFPDSISDGKIHRIIGEEGWILAK